MAGCEIILDSQQNTIEVLKNVIGLYRTDSEGKYSFNCQVGRYLVFIQQPNRMVRPAGYITVKEDSVNSSLNAMLEQIDDSSITPDIVLQVKRLRDEAVIASGEAKSYAEESKSSESSIKDMLAEVGSDGFAATIGTSTGENVQYLIDRTMHYVDSVDSFGEIVGVDGRAVRTRSYSSGGISGGGIYYYDSSKSSDNDGVTVINGWVRVFDNTRKASDAGIVDGMNSTEATRRLNILFGTAKDGVKFDLENIEIKLSTHARLENAKRVEIYNYRLVGDGGSWLFENNDRGIFIASYCDFIEMHRGEIIGVRMSQPNTSMSSSITASGRIQDGDSGMEFKYCHDINIHHNKVHGVKTWGILSTNGARPHVWKNTVYDCARQSGISVCIGTTNDVEDVSIHDNTIFNIGLYGVEVEKWTKTARRIHIYDNDIMDSQYGINLVGLVRGVNAHDNNISGCYYAIAGTSLNASLASEMDARNLFQNNLCVGNYAGIAPSNSHYVTYSKNTINGIRSGDYFNTNPYNTVEIVASSNSFYSLRDITAGTSININGVVCTVQSSSAVTESEITEKIGLTTVYLIVCDILPDGVLDYTPFKVLLTSGDSYGYWPFYQVNYNEYVTDNLFINLKNGFYQTAPATGDNGCFAVGNTFNNVTVPIGGGAYGILIRKSILQNCTRYTDAPNKVSLNLVGLNQIQPVGYSSAITAGATKPTVTFYNYNSDIIVRARVKVKNVSWTTSNEAINIALSLNGALIGYINVKAKATDVDSFIDLLNGGLLPPGPNTLRITDTTGSLSFDSWSVDLFVAG